VTLPTSGTIISSVTALPGAVTGTPSSTTYLRGDGTWATVSASSNSISNGTSNVTVNSSGGTVSIATAGTTALTVDTSQNIGIGVTPNTWSSSWNGKIIQLGYGTLGGFSDARLEFFNNCYVNTSGNVTYSTTSGATVYAMGAASGVHAWYNAPSGTAGTTVTLTQAMTLDANGYLLVGYTSSNGAYKLQVNSQIFATSAIIATSDKNYKTNITPISNSLALVNKLNPVSFDWKEHSVHDFDTKNTYVGFLAQDVQKVFPQECQSYFGSMIQMM
jgi:hypothetical protein